jgi:CRP/FNR family cyclic AMP-dependent transcriptional regulator
VEAYGQATANSQKVRYKTFPSINWGHFMQAINPRSGRKELKVLSATNSLPPVGQSVHRDSQQIFLQKHNPATSQRGAAREEHQKLKNRLVSRGLPVSLIDELLEQATIVSYDRGCFVLLQGGRTDLLLWVSSGLVDILCPGQDGEQIIARVLGPGEFFGFVQFKDHKERSAPAFQVRARTSARIGFVTRAQACKVLAKQDPALLAQILGDVVAAWSELSFRETQFLGKNYAARLEMVLADLTAKFGVKESRGILLIPDFVDGDFAEMIGCSKPMVSKLISEMISAGRLATHGRHYILLDDSVS